MEAIRPISVERQRLTRWDALAVLLVIGLLVFLAQASKDLYAPLSELDASPVSLSPAYLPEYAARTTLRMSSRCVSRSCSRSLTQHWQRKTGERAILLIPTPGHSAIGSNPRLPLGHGRVFHVARAGPDTGGGIRRNLRDLHQPGVEHGLQLLSVAADDPVGAHGGGACVSALAVDALLARGGSICHARSSSGT